MLYKHMEEENTITRINAVCRVWHAFPVSMTVNKLSVQGMRD